ncbi:hypothetical protein ACFV1N_47435 [Streptosporangium canum]|uniref:hypothetical protein n=1 Tax=Streptosporangium canum TaxID=324952 RepID=UPI00368306A6
MTRLNGFANQMALFDSAQVIAGHSALQKHLEETQTLALRMAQMVAIDAELTATWLQNRRPRKGKRISLVERLALARRTRAHGRSGRDALLQVVTGLRRMADLHGTYMDQEKKAQPKRR